MRQTRKRSYIPWETASSKSKEQHIKSLIAEYEQNWLNRSTNG